MAPRKSERLVNLTIALLSTRHYLTRDQIRTTVQDYRDLGDEAFMRQFERDKDDLRNLGVPIEVRSVDTFFDDEPGYRIVRTDFELPPVSFTPDEALILGVALRVWQQASTADQVSSAMVKLRAAGVDTDASRLEALAPTLTATEAAFEPLWSATLSRTRVAFQYRAGEAERTVDPWRLASRRGAWYLLGFDHGPGEPRLFKLRRMASVPRTVGKAGAFDRPDADLDALMTALTPPEADATAVLAIRDGRAPALRRKGEQVTRDVPAGFGCWAVPYATAGDMVAQVASYGPDVIVVEPTALANGVRAHLSGLVDALGVE